MKVHWIPQLQAHEWPGSVIEDMHPSILSAAVDVRMESGVPMTPSSIIEAHVRHEGDSRHSTEGGTRLSDATDYFIPSDVDSTYKMIQAVQRHPSIGGWGVYFDTKPSVMFHIDGRPQPLQWLRVNGIYIYAYKDPAFYYAELAKQLEKLR